MSLRHVKLVSLTYVPVGTSLQRLKLVGFIYVPVRRRKNVSNRTFLLKYQLKRRDDVSAWSRAFKLVTEMAHFFLGGEGEGGGGTKVVRFPGTSSDSVSLRYQMVRRYNVSKVSVSFRC